MSHKASHPIDLPIHESTASAPAPRREVDAGYVLRVWSAHDELRAEEGVVITRYLARLEAFALSLYARYASYGRALPLLSLLSRVKARVSRWGGLVGVLRGVALLPSFFAQAAKLQRTLSSSKPAVLVLAIPSSRLPLRGSPTSVRNNLACFARSLEASNESLSAKVHEAGLVLLLDPLPLSRYWSHRRACWAENVLIIDGAFLLALWLRALLRNPRQALARFRGLVHQCQAGMPPTSAPRPRRVILCALIAQAYAEAFPFTSDFEALFFTLTSAP